MDPLYRSAPSGLQAKRFQVLRNRNIQHGHTASIRFPHTGCAARASRPFTTTVERMHVWECERRRSTHPAQYISTDTSRPTHPAPRIPPHASRSTHPAPRIPLHASRSTHPAPRLRPGISLRNEGDEANRPCSCYSCETNSYTFYAYACRSLVRYAPLLRGLVRRPFLSRRTDARAFHLALLDVSPVYALAAPNR